MSKRRGQNEGSIYQMADGRWRAAVSLGWKQNADGKTVWKRRVITAGTRAAVQDELKRVLRDQQQGLPIAPERITVSSFLNDWLRTVAQPSVRPKTLRTYSYIVRTHIEPSIGSIPLNKLTPQHVRNLLNEKLNSKRSPRCAQETDAQAHQLSPRTVKHILVTLRTALETAAKDGIVPRNVASLVDPPRTIPPEPKTFTPEDARQFVESVKGDRLEALFTLAASSGLRQGEILGLQIVDVDLNSATLTVRAALQRVDKKLVRVEPKSKSSSRVVSLPAVTVSALAAHLTRREQEKIWAGDRWQETGYLFTTTTGTPIDARSVIRRFHAVLKRANLPKLRFHDLRHSTATLLLAQGVSPRYITELLGHSQVSFTMQTYAHVLAPIRKEVAAKMDEILSSAPESPIATSVATKTGKKLVN